MEPNFTELLANALQQAADAHGAYQASHGADPEWPVWYADRMTSALSEDRDRLHAVLLAALYAAGAAHGVHETEDLGGVYDEEWPAWYAAHMTTTLGEDAPLLAPAIATYVAEKDPK